MKHDNVGDTNADVRINSTNVLQKRDKWEQRGIYVNECTKMTKGGEPGIIFITDSDQPYKTKGMPGTKPSICLPPLRTIKVNVNGNGEVQVQILLI